MTGEPGTTRLAGVLRRLREGQCGFDEFYRVFLENEVFVPTVPPAEPVEPDTDLSDEEEFETLVIEAEGETVLPVFDSLERLEGWVGEVGYEVGYMSLDALTLVHSVDPEVKVVLNPDVQDSYVFEVAELELLRTPEVSLVAGVPDLPDGASLSLEEPSSVPDGLTALLQKILGGQAEIVTRAWLLSLQDKNGDLSVLLIGLELVEDSEELFQSVVGNIATNVSHAFYMGDDLEFLNLTDSGLLADIQGTVTPIYESPTVIE